MRGLLLDTHALYWLVCGEKIVTSEALVAIGLCQEAGTLFISPISAWELSVAARKPKPADRPDFGELPPEQWFRQAVRALRARVAPIHHRIACEAAAVVAATGHKDPGDCILIATARIKAIPIVTRDRVLQAVASERSGYLAVIAC